jgi:hypothetical protein
MFDALAPGTDPDRMKGALYVLWSKGTGKCRTTCVTHASLRRIDSGVHAARQAGPSCMGSVAAHCLLQTACTAAGS